MAVAKETTTPDIEEGTTSRHDSVDPDVEKVDPDVGLTYEQVRQMLEKWGKNEIEAPSVPIYYIFLRQFTGFLPVLIALAALISLAVQGELVKRNGASLRSLVYLTCQYFIYVHPLSDASFSFHQITLTLASSLPFSLSTPLWAFVKNIMLKRLSTS